MDVLQKLKKKNPQYLLREDVETVHDGAVTDSSTRFGYYLMHAKTCAELEPYLPIQQEDAE